MRWRMKPRTIAICCVLMLAAYVAGSYRPLAWVQREKEGAGRQSGAEGTASSGGDEAPAKLLREAGTRAGSRRSEASFAKGEARAWFTRLATEEWEEDITGLLRMVQVCGTLDEAQAQELTEELGRMRKAREDGDPAMEAAFESEMLEISLASALLRLSRLNPEAALRFVEGAPNLEDRDKMLGMIHGSLAFADPAKSRAELARLQGKELQDGLEGAMNVLAKRDPAAALDLIEKYPQAEMDRERRKLVERLAARDPAKAIEVATRLVNAGRNPEVFGELVSSWAEKDKAAALAWAEGYSGPGALEAKEMLARRGAEDDPRKAAATFASFGAQGAGMSGTAGRIADQLAEVDLPATREWIESLPQGPARDEASDEMVEQWIKSEPMEAAAWIDKMPAGKGRDDVAERLVKEINRRFPQEALDWAGSLQEEKKRKDLQEEVIKEWRRQDPEAAEAAARKLEGAGR